MELFELTHRLKMMLTLEIAMNRMMEDLSGKDIEAEKFTSITLNATKAFREINAFIEKGNFGISEEPTDPLSELSDELTFYHKNKNK